jgi:uncharacterized cupin superfamily protein
MEVSDMPETRQPDAPKTHLSAAEIASAPEVHIRHPLNSRSDLDLRSLGRAVGLKRVALSIGRIPPAGESFAYHSHERDEEFLYILAGRGRAEIEDEIIEVGPGGFMGFSTPSVAHHLTNPYHEDLVYLMGGESSGYDIGTFPRQGRKIIFSQGKILVVAESDLKALTFADFLPDGLPEPLRGPEDG